MKTRKTPNEYGNVIIYLLHSWLFLLSKYSQWRWRQILTIKPRFICCMRIQFNHNSFVPWVKSFQPDRLLRFCLTWKHRKWIKLSNEVQCLCVRFGYWWSINVSDLQKQFSLLDSIWVSTRPCLCQSLSTSLPMICKMWRQSINC